MRTWRASARWCCPPAAGPSRAGRRTARCSSRPSARAGAPSWASQGAATSRSTSRRSLAALEAGPYQRTWELAQQLRRRRRDAGGLRPAVLTYLRDGFTYTETPPPSAYNLDGFLFDAKAGYCQQFSGAMALLLRMAGVPTRVVTGFTTGSLDTKTREYVVRDFDAHSWVEVWYPGIGWVTFDPTPAARRRARSPTSPARARPRRQRRGARASATSRPTPAVARSPPRPARRGCRSRWSPSPSWPWPRAESCCGAVAVAAAGRHPGGRGRRRRARARPAPRAPPSGARHDAARARGALRPQPRGGRLRARAARPALRRPPAAPTPAQRRGLRSELARGMGLVGRLRAWWALPPRAH